MPKGEPAEEEAQRLRAAARRERVTLTKTRLGEQSADQPLVGRAAIELAAELSLAAWAISGSALPAYTSATMPTSARRAARRLSQTWRC